MPVKHFKPTSPGRRYYEVLSKESLRFKDRVASEYADLVYNGLWFTPLREALDAFVDATQGPVTGTVRLKLYKGNIITAGRKSPFSLYREDFATFGQEDVYDQSHAEGFIRLFGLTAPLPPSPHPPRSFPRRSS